MRCACIDVGSNTTRLLVAEADASGRMATVATAKAMTRLGAGRAADGTLDPARVEAALAAVATQAQIARQAGAARVLVVATAAVRGDGASGALRARLASAAGADAVVLDPEDEARLAFGGATRELSADGDVAVVDAGGGSTELVVGRCGSAPTWSRSVALGSAVLTDEVAPADPPAAEDVGRLRARAAEALAEMAPPPAVAAWAVGGSATSLAWMLGGGDLGPEALARATAALCRAPAQELGEAHGIEPERVRMLPAGLAILEAASGRLGASLQIASGGLREGVLDEMLSGIR